MRLCCALLASTHVDQKPPGDGWPHLGTEVHVVTDEGMYRQLKVCLCVPRGVARDGC